MNFKRSRSAQKICFQLSFSSQKAAYLAKADWRSGNLDLRLLKVSRRSLTGEVNELRSTSTLLYSVHGLFGERISLF